MMKYLWLLLVLFVPSLSAQIPSVITWDRTKPCCSARVENDATILQYVDDRLMYEISFTPDPPDKYMQAVVTVQNRTDKPFTVYPTNFQLTTGSRIYTAIPVASVLKEVQGRGAWRLGMARVLGSVSDSMNSEPSVTNNSGNVVIINQTDNSGKEIARQRAEQQQAVSNASIGEAVQRFGLRANTVNPGATISGIVYFKKEKLTPIAWMSFTIGSVTYEIPVGTKNRPPL